MSKQDYYFLCELRNVLVSEMTKCELLEIFLEEFIVSLDNFARKKGVAACFLFSVEFVESLTVKLK